MPYIYSGEILTLFLIACNLHNYYGDLQHLHCSHDSGSILAGLRMHESEETKLTLIKDVPDHITMGAIFDARQV